MTAQNPAIFLQAGSHPAEDVRRYIGALALDRAGVIASGDLAVTQNGTPNMSVNVAGGRVFIPGSQQTYQGTYFAENRGTTNLSIAASDPTNGRIDIVVARVEDSVYSGSNNLWSLAVITGTPAPSPVAPAAPANSHIIAQVSVAAAASTITNANITDLRARAATINGPVICTSTTQPTATEGLTIIETDKDRVKVHDGAAFQRVGWFSATGRTGGEWRRTAGLTANNATNTPVTWTTEDVDSDGFLTPTSATFTVPAGLGGLYIAQCALAQSAAAGGRTFVDITPSTGTAYLARSSVVAGEFACSVTGFFALPAAATLTCNFFQTSGAAMTITGSFVVYRLGL